MRLRTVSIATGQPSKVVGQPHPDVVEAGNEETCGCMGLSAAAGIHCKAVVQQRLKVASHHELAVVVGHHSNHFEEQTLSQNYVAHVVVDN